jgi:hypothetical protein
MANWQSNYWGEHYPQLLKIKKEVDPENFLTCHHCVVITIYIFFVHPCIRKDSFAKRDFVIKFKIIILSDIIAFCLYLLHILGIVHPFITVSEVDSRVTPTHPGFRNAK